MNIVVAHILIAAELSGQMGILSQALESEGHRVFSVPALDKAQPVLSEQRIDLIIVDIDTDKSQDVTAFQAIKSRFPSLPVLLITGSPEAEGIEKTEFAGHVTRPFRLSHIESLIRKILRPAADTESLTASGTILVVDDDDIFRSMLIRSLRLSGYDVMGASDGKMAIDALAEGGISTVIADVNMPYMDGITLLKEIKVRWPHIPVILMTGYFSATENASEEDISPDGFLMKPFKIQSITDILTSVLSR
jgi:DNA-binding NtrC family response regulator